MAELEEWRDSFVEIESLSGRYLAAVTKCVEMADHLEPTDEADVELAKGYARVIDSAFDSGDKEAIHRASCVPMPSLHKTLTGLGLTPEGRKNLGLDDDDDSDDW